jgi:nitric oxide reductase activation protein
VRRFYLTLDPKADDYVVRIFGPENFMAVDHVNRLPMLYAAEID